MTDVSDGSIMSPRAARIQDPVADGIVLNAWYAVGVAVAALKDRQRLGGYFCLLSRAAAPDPFVFYHEPVGAVGPEKAEKYFNLSLEKAIRVGTRGHQSSWQSRDPDSGKWGGAIIAGSWILSFSGLPELADEAVMLVTAVMSRLMTVVEARAIADISQNPYFVELMTVVDLDRLPA